MELSFLSLYNIFHLACIFSMITCSHLKQKKKSCSFFFSVSKMAKFGSFQHLGLAMILGFLGFVSLSEAELKMGFYHKTCPNAEKIVQDFVNEHIHNAPSLAAALIRMHFHDCFVRGCDASILINATSNNRQVEKVSPPNLTVRGFDFIDRVKSLLEKECPGVVSCADVITLATRDSIVATGGPFWNVPTGRRDGRISNAAESLNNIPPPFGNFSTLRKRFADQGLDVKDLVLLSGAHTIGVSHCTSFSNRLFNFTGVGDQDPSLDSEYAANLRSRKCRSPSDNMTKVEMDPGSRKSFDLSYYNLLLKRRGLFESDNALTTDSTALALVRRLVAGSMDEFFAEFAKSMEKMGRIGVKTGSDGEIRRYCAFVN
ncbi:PREDICTED: peroxidase 39 [Tarenaya hassleriana]|uniref:peroxidase 39 n=1 Tax=Tarenaya hassleriana TaxID=28532 RepID=UPI00053CA754|nr:PREDICTED: peroxidase 39 [Tarenaya hassleriana]